MIHEPRWPQEASDDLQSGHDWYDEREPGLGRQLAIEVFETIARVVSQPLLPRRYEHPSLPPESTVRRVHLRRFAEYAVVYTLVQDTTWIIAIAHSKRQPGYWIDRLRSLP